MILSESESKYIPVRGSIHIIANWCYTFQTMLSIGTVQTQSDIVPPSLIRSRICFLTSAGTCCDLAILASPYKTIHKLSKFSLPATVLIVDTTDIASSRNIGGYFANSRSQ